MAYRLMGIAVPRNADDQHAAATLIPQGEEAPGDLYFFARNGEPAHHVGLAVGDGQMLDACYAAGRVQQGPLSEDRLKTLVGCGSLLPCTPAGIPTRNGSKSDG
ncbi:C40 family peptidase [Streptomyces sp. NPDC059168]|uniref:C40 family peptidase n=1 Tax=Streptomyces sp. NPDC059168 TaxID=3346753 RepID=UPI0036C56AAE